MHVRGARTEDHTARRIDQLPVVQPVGRGDEQQEYRAEHGQVAYTGREQRVVAQVAIAGDERIRSSSGDGRLDRRQSEAVDDRDAQRGDQDQTGQPAARRGQCRQRPDIEGDVLAKGRVGLGEWHLSLESQPGLPLPESGQAEDQSDEKRHDRDGGQHRGHTARIPVLL